MKKYDDGTDDVLNEISKLKNTEIREYLFSILTKMKVRFSASKVDFDEDNFFKEYYNEVLPQTIKGIQEIYGENIFPEIGGLDKVDLMKKIVELENKYDLDKKQKEKKRQMEIEEAKKKEEKFQNLREEINLEYMKLIWNTIDSLEKNYQQNTKFNKLKNFFSKSSSGSRRKYYEEGQYSKAYAEM